MVSVDVPPSYPPPPPPTRPVRPKITITIPDASSPMPMTPRTPSVYWTPSRYHPKPPGTPGSHISDPHGHPYFGHFGHMYHNKASEFMFKQFEGFKDFTVNTAKSGLSVGEKTAFWFYNKLRVLSKRWFTHLFLTFSLTLYSVLGAALFVTLESGHESKFDKNLTTIRREVADKIMDTIIKNNITFQDNSLDLFTYIEDELAEYETNFTECMKHLNNNDTHKKTWSFWNSMFYAGTIYTTIVEELDCLDVHMKVKSMLGEWTLFLAVMSEETTSEDITPTFKIPIITETEAQTSGQLVIKIPDDIEADTMNTEYDKQMSIRKRRNLSKNRAHAARQREKTPEPNRTPVPHEDTPTSEDEDFTAPRSPREAEADDTYEEMKRLVQERAKTKDPVYDINTDEILEARVSAQIDRRRRSISPFAVQDKEQEEASKLERKGSFIDPTNKLLSTNYTLSPKEDSRRDSIIIEPSKEPNKSLSPPATNSPREKEFPYPMPSTPKKQEQIVYPDEIRAQVSPTKKPKTPIKNENVFTFDEKDTKQNTKATLKTPETPGAPGELVTKIIELERSPSKKLTHDKKPVVEIRERIVRTPSRKTAADAKPTIVKQSKPKEELQPQSRVPPVKPARSKSATRFGNKTSESEMSEDQTNQSIINAASKRKVVPTPRRFQKNRSPKINRSQSVNRAETVKVIDRIDKTGTGMSQTSCEIIELMQKARARSLSIPKDDPRLPSAYKKQLVNKGKVRELKTPNKTPNTLRQSRGISCPKTIQIISDREILSGLSNKPKPDIEQGKHSRQSSGYIDASQSEYTSSCYSSSPSENEYEFDLSERTAELTRKLNILSLEVDKRATINNILLAPDDADVIKTEIEKPALRKRSVAGVKGVTKKESKEARDAREGKVKTKTKFDDKNKQVTRSRWRIIANWQQFKEEENVHCEKIRLLRNRCICDLILLIIFCGLGGMMFKSLEGSFENAFKCGSRGMKRDFIESLWRGSHYLREEDWKSMARSKLFEFENQLHTAHEAGVTSYSGQRSWNFMNSFVYCMTLVTTIGYGHIAPKTTYGRVATIIYAIIGIPLFLIVLADFGKLFTRIIKFFWAFIRRFYYTRSCRKVRRTVHVEDVMKGLNIVYDVVRRPSQIFSEEDEETNQAPVVERKPSDVPPPLPPKPSHLRDPENDTEPETPAPSVFEIDDEFNLPISLAIFILVVYMVIGALGFNIWEKWNFLESFYFVFISMSTIGLGDFVPDHPMFMMASILYLIFGLALTSMCINVVQVKLSDTFKKASAKLGATIGLKVAEEDGSLVPNTPPLTEIVPIHKPKIEVDEKSKEPNDNDSKNR